MKRDKKKLTHLNVWIETEKYLLVKDLSDVYHMSLSEVIESFLDEAKMRKCIVEKAKEITEKYE